MAPALSTWLFGLLVLWLGILNKSVGGNPTQCYVPICGSSTEYSKACDYVTLHFSSGMWTNSWADSGLPKPEHVCTPEQVQAFLEKKTSHLVVEADGSSSVAPSPLLPEQYLLALVKWVVDCVPEEWWPGSELSRWLILIIVTVRSVLLGLVSLASSWNRLRSVRNMLQALAAAKLFSWAGGVMCILFWWIRGRLHWHREGQLQDTTKDEKIRDLEQQVETLQRRLAAKEGEQAHSHSHRRRRKKGNRRRRRKRSHRGF